ncbi:unnamed protein product [Rotaria sp. Silwood1]|nr:unnamed protein product [Rotaria sp. Silwood1]CAF3558489.1 unnamed protein product [Rotaria sp. Silwood1]
MASSMKWSVPETIDIAKHKSQQEFVVISWNVLHMIHEINYVYDSSPVINRYSINNDFSNEKIRLNDITKTLSELLIKHSTMECFICLQEVPGDLLPMLHEMFDSHANSILACKPVMHIQTYSRKPRIRVRQGSSVYNDSNESLVTIHYNPKIISIEKALGLEHEKKSVLYNDQVLWTPCPTDAGKGALTVTTISGLSVEDAENKTILPKDTAFSRLSNRI